MHDIWNPWHGCQKCSEGCQNCYMYTLDKKHNGVDSSVVTKTSGLYYPLLKIRNGSFKIKSGEMIRVCRTSDFFVEGADEWRDEVWNIIHERPDVKFFLLTKRPERVEKCLPKDWGEGLENVFFNVTCENQRRADERIPILHALPFKHKGVMTAPLIGAITIDKYLQEGQIEQLRGFPSVSLRVGQTVARRVCCARRDVRFYRNGYQLCKKRETKLRKK